MDGYVIDVKGRQTALPVILSYRVRHGMGVPCDSFELTCKYEPEAEDALKGGCCFLAVDREGVVFRGILDEYETEIGLSGKLLSVSGRGMAARLLDNECEAAVYGFCTIDTILRNYVTHCGITDVSYGNLGSCWGYTVESGESCWTALYNFALYVGGVKPRFSKDGRLLLKHEEGRRRRYGASLVSDFRHNCRSYGRISEVTVKNYYGVTVSRVRDREYIDLGGSARRVLKMPRKPGYDRVRYSGEFQIRSAKENKDTYTITVPLAFGAFPGDEVMLTLPEAGIKNGLFDVIETESRMDASGVSTVITMVKGE